MATAAMVKNLTPSLADAIERRRELMRRGEITSDNGQGGYRVLGKLVELRYERSSDHPPIPEKLKLWFQLNGNVIQWDSNHHDPKQRRCPLLGISRQGTLLFASKVPALPQVADPNFSLSSFVVMDGNRIPLAAIPPDMRANLRNSDGTPVVGIDKKTEQPLMLDIRFADHCCGSMGEFFLTRPITEGLVKLAGVAALQKIFFTPHGEEFPGFYLDPATGEGHFLGGHSDLENPVVAEMRAEQDMRNRDKSGT